MNGCRIQEYAEDSPVCLSYFIGYKLGKLLIEGKTKRVYDLPEEKGICMIISKDRITAGDGVKAHDLEGKAAISTKTNGQVFGLLNAAGTLSVTATRVSELMRLALLFSPTIQA